MTFGNYSVVFSDDSLTSRLLLKTPGVQLGGCWKKLAIQDPGLGTNHTGPVLGGFAPRRGFPFSPSFLRFRV